MGRVVRLLLLALLALVVLALGVVVGGVGGLGWLARDGEPLAAGTAAPGPAPRGPAPARAGKQILFGDLHVHTSYSADARVYALPVFEGEGVHPPADACDFARYCSRLDFWSINDHAESLTPAAWAETVEAVRQCNARAGDPEAPDLVSFLGWEWSQGGLAGDAHYGHRNVVLRDTEPDRTPTRPIASAGLGGVAWPAIGALLSLADPGPIERDAGYHRFLWDNLWTPRCEEGVPVRELSDDCREVARTPADLYARLDDWGFPALVIPHGLAWGTTNPPGATFDHQLGVQHDPDRQRLIEVYSGHGNSEVFRDVRHREIAADGTEVCPAPTEDFTPCCWRAGELARERCQRDGQGDCEAAVRRARQEAFGGLPVGDVGARLPGAAPEDFLDCGQLRNAFLPAFSYRPRQSVQYGLALRRGENDEPGARFRFGLIGSSDNHRARPGTGYKEFGLGAMTDGNRPLPAWADGRDDWAAGIARLAAGAKRADAFYTTGGLVAAHAQGRDRVSIYDALRRREVYGTSGPRILLWFDLVHGDGTRSPMGGEVVVPGTPRFEVRALGAHEQRAGCPDSTWSGLGPERTRALCLGECHHPGDRRLRITRIEVVRIRPQRTPSDPVAARIDDPWRVLACEDTGDGCRVAFEDPAFADDGGDAVYYVRAIQEPTEALNGDALSCTRDAEGRCTEARLCRSGGFDAPVPEHCRAPVEERAWSSPLFVTRPG